MDIKKLFAVESRPSFVEQQRNSRDFLLVSQLGDSHPLNHERALTAVLIVLGVALATEHAMSRMVP